MADLTDPRALATALRQQPVTLDARMAEFGFDPNAQRLSALPNPNGSLSPADWTAPQWLYDAAKAAALPGHVMQGGAYTPGDVTGLALGLMGAPAGVAVRPGPVASRSPMLYNPPAKPPRPFAADYPRGALADEFGNLTHDVDGRPLTAAMVVGRRLVGMGDTPLPPEGLVSIGAEITGGFPQAVARSSPELGGDVGRYVVTRDRRSGQVIGRDTFIDKGQPPEQVPRVLAHETGHALDEIAGQIPAKGLNTELRQVYNTLNTGQERTRNLTGPQHLGYRNEEVPRELMAEALRAYMADPNYLKTVAPGAAAAIRQAVNGHPTLSKSIQFNAAAPLTATGLGAMTATDPQADERAALARALRGGP